MAEQRELSGVLSRNRKRETDKQPEFKGSAMIDGVAYWLSAWVKEGQDGKFFSLAFMRKEMPKTEARPASGSPELQAKYGSNGRRDDHRRGVENDEIPF
jgi:hypothetical protein